MVEDDAPQSIPRSIGALGLVSVTGGTGSSIGSV